MKKTIVPVVLFLAVFAVSILFQKYTMILWEYRGLFLFSPDYFHEVFTHPWPLSNLIADFLVQFYYYPVLGALLNALLAIVIYFCAGKVFRFIPGTFIPAAIACAAWFLAARSIDLVPAVRIMLFTGLAAAVSHFAHYQPTTPVLWVEVLTAAAVCVFFIFAATDKTIAEKESRARLNNAVLKSEWKEVLEIATPANAVKDKFLLPYALLALGESGQLPYRIAEYPVTGPEDFDFGTYFDDGTLYFNEALAVCMSDYPEAIRSVFQMSCSCKHNTCFGALRSLVRYNALLGNRRLAEKYVSLLSRTVMNSSYGQGYLARMTEVRDSSQINTSWKAPVHSHDGLVNLETAINSGRVSKALLDRVLCMFIVSGRNDLFVKNFEAVKQLYDPVPPIFAMQLDGGPNLLQP